MLIKIHNERSFSASKEILQLLASKWTKSQLVHNLLPVNSLLRVFNFDKSSEEQFSKDEFIERLNDLNICNFEIEGINTIKFKKREIISAMYSFEMNPKRYYF